MWGVGFDGRYAALALAGLAFIAPGCEASVMRSEPCSRPSDCPSPLVCEVGYCRAQCTTSRDCPLGARCLVDPTSLVGACSLVGVDDCSGGADCFAGFVCVSGDCVNACGSIVRCPDGVCEAGACVVVRDLDGGVSDGGGPDDACATRVELCNGIDDDCDNTTDEGAEASCNLPGAASSVCVSGACALFGCTAGLYDCDAMPANGCECAPPAHASAGCAAMHCNFTCDPGYAAVGTSCDVAPPRPIAPLSTSTVTSRRPTLRWALAPGTDGARVELCRDRACTSMIEAIDVTGISAVPTSDLPTGVVFWRLHSRAGTTLSTAPGPVWQLVVGARTAPVDTSWGTTLDVDGDGYADLAVGAAAAASNAGRVHVYRGSASGVGASATFTLDGPDGGGSGFGDSVASAGDVNGDGYADLVVGAPTVSANTGRVYVYFGGAAGLASTPAITLVGPDGAGAFFGRPVASAGDVNGDGYADFAVGAAMFGSSAGRAYLYLGSASGLATTPTTMLDGRDGIGGQFGCWVASVGDVDGDGFAELAVGALGAVSGTGRTYLFSGSASGLVTTPSATLTGPDGASGNFGYSVASAGDVNGDGYADLVVGAPGVSSATGRAYVYVGSASGLVTTPRTTLTGDDAPNNLFGFPVASAGDVNGDGFADVAVGAYQYVSSTGRVHVYLGSASGLATTASPRLTGPDGIGGYFGGSVAGAGDVNGDGVCDLAVGAFVVSSNTGRAYVYLGSSSGLATSAATMLTGPDGMNSNFGYFLASLGTTSDEPVAWCRARG